jgi:hypothetical protein
MNATDTMETVDTRPSGRDVPRDMGFPGRVAVSWAMASGVLAGGVLLAVLTLMDRMSAFGIFLTSTALFLGGGLFGFLHGAVLGWMGREATMDAAAARHSLALASMYVIPGLGFAWVVSSLISQTVGAQFTGNLLALAGVGVAWLAGAVICMWAARTGFAALANAYVRWEDTFVGTVLVALTFGALLVLFLTERPELWGTQLRVGAVGAVLLAGFATTWISGPGITLPLWLSRRIPDPRVLSPPFPDTSRTTTGLPLAAVVGAALAAVALWLAPSLGTAPALDLGAETGQLVLLSAARALVDEVLFRLFIVTSLVWVFRRWHPVHAEEATTVAVLVAVFAEVLVYLPGYLAQGLPDAGALLQQIIWLTAAPAVAMGLLFVWRGLPAAFAGAFVFRLVVGLVGG